MNMAYGGIIEDVEKNLRPKCTEINQLILKKSLIEQLNQDTEICGQVFTAKLLLNCPQINCHFYLNLINKIKENKGGNVIGK